MLKELMGNLSNQVSVQKMPIRILHVINGMGFGGAEDVILNWYRNIDRSRVQFDFIIRSNYDDHVEEIKKMGGHVYKTSEFPRHFLKNIRETNLFLRRHPEYRAIHVHGNALVYIYPIILGKKLGIPTRIMHIQNTSAAFLLADIVHRFNRRFVIDKYATVKLACSKAAAEFGFHGKCNLLLDAIDVKQYNCYDKSKIRKKYDLEFGVSKDTLIIGHVGRFLSSKNQCFLVDCFREIKKRRPDSVLILVGAGPTEPNIRRRIVDDGVCDSVLLVGERDDVPELLNYFDGMIFPSFFEGMPLVPMEAQASKLHVLCSEYIPEETFITPYMEKMSLKSPPDKWAKKILSMIERKEDVDVVNAFRKSKCDIDSVTEYLLGIYMNENNCL